MLDVQNKNEENSFSCLLKVDKLFITEHSYTVDCILSVENHWRHNSAAWILQKSMSFVLRFNWQLNVSHFPSFLSSEHLLRFQRLSVGISGWLFNGRTMWNLRQQNSAKTSADWDARQVLHIPFHLCIRLGNVMAFQLPLSLCITHYTFLKSIHRHFLQNRCRKCHLRLFI